MLRATMTSGASLIQSSSSSSSALALAGAGAVSCFEGLALAGVVVGAVGAVPAAAIALSVAAMLVADAPNKSPGEYRFFTVTISHEGSLPCELAQEFCRCGGEAVIDFGVDGDAGDDGVGVRPSFSES
jgi:hypothetical protein